MFKDEYLLDFINTENLGQLCTYLQALKSFYWYCFMQRNEQGFC